MYPAAATAAKRKREGGAAAAARAEAAEADARMQWEAQREEILVHALTASPGGRPLPILASLVSQDGARSGSRTPDDPAQSPRWGHRALTLPSGGGSKARLPWPGLPQVAWRAYLS